MPSAFTFVPPPEAPVFYPTSEEFKDPLAYLMKIRPICIKTGICKIVPPKCWNPPFAVNMAEFSFTPRIQRLYELELNFLSRLYKFVKLQGGEKIRVPSIAGRYLDLYALHKQVAEAGGYRQACDNHSWPTIAEKLGYQTRHAQSIRNNYEKLLLSFDQTISNQTQPAKGIHRPISRASSYKRYKNTTDENKINYSASKELKNLQFFGPGPKAAVPVEELPKSFVSEINVGFHSSNNLYLQIDEYNCRVCCRGDDETNLLICDTDTCQACYHLYCLNPPLRSIPKCQWKCPECVRNICCGPMDVYGFPQSSKTYSLQEFGVMADEFKSAYFKRPCTEVPCAEVEQEFWRILQEYNDDVIVEYGADIHSSSQGSGFPTKAMLKNLVGTASQLAEAKKYAESPWNLNILPLLDKSVLRFIKGNIDGMKIPWCYVGMVFSSFCWHIEDHWSYSINFNHWGEPKTWYGVSRLHADEFERAMRKNAPELFEQAPDLLHHITTNINPNILQAEGVPIYRTDQHCGEFVVTFPRAYHAGFNQGFNFAEAVNICLPDWLPIGRACIEHYAEIKRHCVFSNDELLCTLAEVAVGNVLPAEILKITNPVDQFPSAHESSDIQEKLPPGCSTSGLDIGAIAIVHQEFTAVLKEERRLRESVIQNGVTQSKKVRFDEMPDDSRVCDFCLTTLFLSGVSCLCANESNSNKVNIESGTDTSSKVLNTISRKRKASGQASSMNESYEEERKPSHMVCLKHVSELCSRCPRSVFVLKYHYSIDELCNLEQCLAERLAHFYSWKNQMSILIKPNDSNSSSSSFSSSNQIIKKEPIDDQDSTSLCESYKSLSGTMTLEELEMKLNEGIKAGYHTDDIFDEAKSLLDRGKHLQQICMKLKSSIIGTGVSDRFMNSSTALSSSTVDLVKFQTRRPATFTVVSAATTGSPTASKVVKLPPNQGYIVLNHEFDVNNPREYDLTRLIEACEQQHPLNMLEDSSVQLIKRLINQSTAWHQSARDTINLLCNLILTNATRSISTTFCVSDHLTSAGFSSDYIPKNFHLLSTDDQALLLLDYTLEKLRSEFPLYVYRIAEWNSLDLLRHALRWLCIYNRYDNKTKCLYWSLPRLRYYLALGEEIISRLTAATSSSQKSHSKGPLSTASSGILTGRQNQSMSPSSNSGTNVAVGTDTALIQILRFILARMHTSVGILTQMSVKAETLIGTLSEALNSTRPSACQEIEDILCQFKDLGIDHFTAVNRQVISPDDERQLIEALDERSFSHIVSIQLVAVSEDVMQIKSLLKRRVDDVLNFCTRDKCSPSIKHPNLTETEILCHLGAFFTSPSTSNHVLNLVTTNQKVIILSDIFDRHLTKLNTLVSNTKCAIQDLYLKFSCNYPSSEEADTNSLLKILLPTFSSEHHENSSIESFKDACLSGYEHGLSVYSQQSKDNLNCISSILKTMFSTGTSCDVCSKRFRISNITRVEDNAENSSCDSCSLCALFSKDSAVYPTYDSLVQFEHHWSTSDSSATINEAVVDLTEDNNYGTLVLLDTPVSIALRICLSRIKECFVELEDILRSHENQLRRILSNTDQSLVQQLPSSLANFIQQITISDSPSSSRLTINLISFIN
ncbi:unnamed protein product [Trichobilharzia szidati]|nr:unnamed protein product [Trichobilharzia szidati]